MTADACARGHGTRRSLLLLRFPVRRCGHATCFGGPHDEADGVRHGHVARRMGVLGRDLLRYALAGAFGDGTSGSSYRVPGGRLSSGLDLDPNANATRP